MSIATGLTHRYLDSVMRAATTDAAVNAAFFEVLGLVRPPASLFHPRIAAAVLRRHRALDHVPDAPAELNTSVEVG